MNLISTPKVFIVILNWNSIDNTLGLLKQVKDIDYLNYEIVIVDNNSQEDESLGRLASVEQADFELLSNSTNLGYAGGNNTGIKYAMQQQADYIWILNPDIRIKPNTLSTMLSVYKKAVQVAVVGCRICYRNNPEIIYSDGGVVHVELGYKIEHIHHQRSTQKVVNSSILDADYVNGSSMLLNANAIRTLGSFREDFFLYFEETDWCIRAKQAGWKVLTTTDTLVYHESSKKGPTYQFYMTRNHIWLAKIHNSEYVRKTILGEVKLLLAIIKANFRTFFKEYKKIFAKSRGLVIGIFTNPRSV